MAIFLGRGRLTRTSVEHLARTRRHHDDAVAQQYGLGDAVRDKHDGVALRLPDSQQLNVHVIAGQRIERAEGLVHEQDLGVAQQGPADRRALLHATGQLVGILVVKSRKTDEIEQRHRRAAASARALCLQHLLGQGRCAIWSARATALPPGKRSRCGTARPWRGHRRSPTCRRSAASARPGFRAACSCRNRWDPR